MFKVKRERLFGVAPPTVDDAPHPLIWTLTAPTTMFGEIATVWMFAVKEMTVAV